MNTTTIGRRIQERRMKKRISQAELGEMTNLSTHHVGSIETGKKGLSIDSLLKIAIALDVTTDSLLLGYEERKTSACVNDISALLDECSTYEKSVLIKLLFFAHLALCESASLLSKE